MATKILVNIGSGNGLLPDSTKPLPESMLTSEFPLVINEVLCDIHLREISQELLLNLNNIMSLEITLLKLLQYYISPNVLINTGIVIQSQ